MVRYGLGIEEATRLTIVSRALQRAMESASSPSKAIQTLASKIAVKRLLYESSEEDPTSEDDVPMRPDFRVDPISTVERRTNRSTRSARLASRSTPKKSRKRCLEDVPSSGEKPQDSPLSSPRPRAESVSEELSAKIAQQNEDSSISSVRAKRTAHRDDSEGAVQAPTIKRQRPASTL
jgi:hypothetical protein